MVKLFAEFTGIPKAYVSHIKCGRKPIGHAIARQIEGAFKLGDGWLDVQHGDTEPRDMAERFFIETALALYRKAPGIAKNAIVKMIKDGSDDV